MSERTAVAETRKASNERIGSRRKQGQTPDEQARDALRSVLLDPGRRRVAGVSAIRGKPGDKRLEQSGFPPALDGRIGRSRRSRFQVACERPARRPRGRRQRANRLAGEHAELVEQLGDGGAIAGLSVARTRTGSPSIPEARWARNRSDAASAQWQSSTSRSSGAREARFAVSQ